MCIATFARIEHVIRDKFDNVMNTQHLLHICAFPGHNSSADWIVSLTAINAPLNGSLAAYALGEQEGSAPQIVSFSPGALLGCLVHILAFVDCRIAGFDLGMDHWGLSRCGPEVGRERRCWIQSGGLLWRAVKQLSASVFCRSPVVESEDNAAYDASVHAMAHCNASIGVAHDCTFYLSIVGTGADANKTPQYPAGWQWRVWLPWMLAMLGFIFRRIFLSTICYLTNRRTYAELSHTLSEVPGFDVEDYRGACDGLCSVFSQSHPRVGVVCESWRVASMPQTATEMHRGVWHVQTQGQDHMGIVPFPASAHSQRKVFADLFTRLRSLAPAVSMLGVNLEADSCWMCAETRSDMSEASDAETDLSNRDRDLSQDWHMSDSCHSYQ